MYLINGMLITFIASEGSERVKPPSSGGRYFSRHMGSQMNSQKSLKMVVEPFCKNLFFLNVELISIMNRKTAQLSRLNPNWPDRHSRTSYFSETIRDRNVKFWRNLHLSLQFVLFKFWFDIYDNFGNYEFFRSEVISSVFFIITLY